MSSKPITQFTTTMGDSDTGMTSDACDDGSKIHAKVLQRKADQKRQPWKTNYKPLESDIPQSLSLHDKRWCYDEEVNEAGYATGGGS